MLQGESQRKEKSDVYVPGAEDWLEVVQQTGGVKSNSVTRNKLKISR